MITCNKQQKGFALVVVIIASAVLSVIAITTQGSGDIAYQLARNNARHALVRQHARGELIKYITNDPQADAINTISSRKVTPVGIITTTMSSKTLINTSHNTEQHNRTYLITATAVLHPANAAQKSVASASAQRIITDKRPLLPITGATQ